MSKKAWIKHQNSRKVYETADLKSMSEAERKLQMNPDSTFAMSTIQSFLPSIPNAAAVAYAVGRGISNMGVINVADEVSVVAVNLGLGAAVGLSAGLAAGALVFELGYLAKQ